MMVKYRLWGVRLLRWHYQREIQDIEANIKIIQDGGIWQKLFSFSMGYFFRSKERHIADLNERRFEMTQFLERTADVID